MNIACHQGRIRALHAVAEPRPQIQNLDGAEVVRITRAEALKIILKYEYLRTLGSGASAFYGLRIAGELLGVEVFGIGGSHEARNICGVKYMHASVCLQRGACVPWAPPNAASFLISRACRQAHADHGWKIFFAYADPEAGDVGVVYQACNWLYVGQGNGRPYGSIHTDWLSPDGRTRISSHCRTMRRKLDMFYLGYKLLPALPKRKYVWFAGSVRERRTLRELCRYPVLPYPKRRDSIPRHD